MPSPGFWVPQRASSRTSFSKRLCTLPGSTPQYPTGDLLSAPMNWKVILLCPDCCPHRPNTGSLGGTSHPTDLAPGDMWTTPLQVAPFQAGLPQFSEVPPLLIDLTHSRHGTSSQAPGGNISPPLPSLHVISPGGPEVDSLLRYPTTTKQWLSPSFRGCCCCQVSSTAVYANTGGELDLQPLVCLCKRSVCQLLARVLNFVPPLYPHNIQSSSLVMAILKLSSFLVMAIFFFCDGKGQVRAYVMENGTGSTH